MGNEPPSDSGTRIPPLGQADRGHGDRRDSRARVDIVPVDWSTARGFVGYRRLVTYTRADESGASLRGAGWRVIAERPARPGWDTPSRRRGTTTDAIPRTLWEAQ